MEPGAGRGVRRKGSSKRSPAGWAGGLSGQAAWGLSGRPQQGEGGDVVRFVWQKHNHLGNIKGSSGKGAGCHRIPRPPQSPRAAKTPKKCKKSTRTNEISLTVTKPETVHHWPPWKGTRVGKGVWGRSLGAQPAPWSPPGGRDLLRVSHRCIGSVPSAARTGGATKPRPPLRGNLRWPRRPPHSRRGRGDGEGRGRGAGEETRPAISTWPRRDADASPAGRSGHRRHGTCASHEAQTRRLGR